MADVDRPPMGRPRLYTRETADAVLCLMIVEARSLTRACEEVGVAKGTFLGWAVDNVDGLFDRYARAKKIRAWARFEEIIEIADDGSNDFAERQRRDGSTEIAFDREHVQRSDLRVKARQWELARILRNEFGDKLDLGGELGIAIKGARERLAGLLGGGDPAPGEEDAPVAAPSDGKA